MINETYLMSSCRREQDTQEMKRRWRQQISAPKHSSSQWIWKPLGRWVATLQWAELPKIATYINWCVLVAILELLPINLPFNSKMLNFQRSCNVISHKNPKRQNAIRKRMASRFGEIPLILIFSDMVKRTSHWKRKSYSGVINLHRCQI